MFVFYWGMLSAITPPVAIASFAAAGIAGAPPMKTGWESMRVGSIIYFMPFFFVLNPALVLQGPLDRGALPHRHRGHRRDLHLRRHPGLPAAASATCAAPAPCNGRCASCFMVGGVVLATPGGGLMPLSNAQMELLGAAFLVPAVALALWAMRR